MATIGTFSRTASGFSGSVKTLNLNVKTVTFSPADGENEKGPDFRIFAGATEFGAAWKKTSREGRDYHSVKLDDPSFPALIYASLVETDTKGDFSLISSRPPQNDPTKHQAPLQGGAWPCSGQVQPRLCQTQQATLWPAPCAPSSPAT